MRTQPGAGGDVGVVNRRPGSRALRGVAWLQIAAGGTGLFTTSVTLLFALSAGWAPLRIAAGLPFYAFVAWAGFRLLGGKPWAVELSVIAQLLQLVHLALGSFAFWAVAGFAVEVGIHRGRSYWGVFLGNRLDIAWWPQEQPTLLVNLVAAVCLLFLAQELLKVEKERAPSPVEAEDP